MFDADDLTKMFEAKILLDKECIELVEGEILERNETISEEIIKSQKIADVLQLEFGVQAFVETKPLVQINEIQCLRPSIAVTKSLPCSQSNIMKAGDTLFVIELTDLRFNYADNQRGRYYGLFNYPEVWFVNLNLGLVEVCTKPNYGFSQCRTYMRGNIIKSESSPNLSLNTNRILDLRS